MSSKNWSQPIVAIYLVAVALRAFCYRDANWLPGINGAYYLLQNRALLERGELALPDLPGIFLLQSALALLLQGFGGLPLSDSLMLAVKLCDIWLPPALCLPIFQLARGWSKGAGRGPGLAYLAALAAALGAPSLALLADFQKNSLALLLYFSALAKGRPALALGLAALTHAGVFSVAALGTLVFVALAQPRALARGCALACGCWLAMACCDLDRALRWLEPQAFLKARDLFWAVLCWPLLARIPAHPALAPKVRNLVRATAVTSVLLLGPWVEGDFRFRFGLILYPGLLLSAVYLALCQRRRGPSALAASLLVLGLIALGVPPTLFLKRPLLPAEGFSEIQQLGKHLAHSALVVAPHGIEWWVAWILRVRIAQPGLALGHEAPTYYLVPQPWLTPPPKAPACFRVVPPERARLVHAGRCFKLYASRED